MKISPINSQKTLYKSNVVPFKSLATSSDSLKKETSRTKKIWLYSFLGAVGASFIYYLCKNKF